MKQIKEIVVNTLIANGFSEAIVIEDRKYQLKIIERVLIGIWLAFSVISIRKTQIFLWVLAVFLAFLCEQIVDLIIRRFKYLNNKNNPWSDLAKQSISRSAYKRINIWFNLFILVFHFYFSVMPSNPILYFIVLELSAMLAIMENHFKQTIKDKFLILGTSILRGLHQVGSILLSGAKVFVPGIIVSTVIGSISGDIWQVLDSLSWLKIFAVALVFFVLTITPSISAQRKTLQEYLDTFKFDQDIFSAERLYKAVLKCQKRSKVRNLSFAVFEKYSDSYSWKWQRRIFEKSKAELSNELERQAGWYFWLNIIILLPIIFVIISILNYIVFPENIIEQWVGGRNIDSVLSILVQNIFFHAPMQPNFRELLFSDPLIKYSAIATLLLIGTNAISYVQDQNKILLGLRLKSEMLNEWLVLLSAYDALREQEYQLIGGFWIKVGKFLSVTMGVPIVLLKDPVDTRLIDRVSESMQNLGWYRFPCIFAISAGDFLNSVRDFVYFGGETSEITIDKIRGNNQLAKCWVWMEAKNGVTTISHFANIDSARRKVHNEAGEMELTHSNLMKSLIDID